MRYLAKLTCFTFLAATQFFLHSCAKKEAEPEPQLTQSLAPPAVVAELRTMGMNIIETGKPVQIVGIYEVDPVELIATNIPNDFYKVGHVSGATRYHFTNQSEGEQTIDMKYIDVEPATSTKGFVAGSGNKFTAFFLTNFTRKNATTKSLEVFSGEWTNNGLKDLQQAFYVVEKNDPDSLFVPVGSIRVSKDQDGLANKVASLRLAADEVPVKKRKSFIPGTSVGL